MKLECPSCQAKYEVADSAIGDKGRNMRCAACGHYWFQKPASALETEVSSNNASIKVKAEKPQKGQSKTKIDFLKKSQAKKKNTNPHEKLRQKSHEKIKLAHFGAIAAGWLLAFSILVSFVFLGILNRNEIVKKWPKSASAFALLGANVNLYGLEINKIGVRAGIDGEGQRIIISGIIQNISGVPKAVPYLRVTLYGAKKHKLASWLIDPQITILDKNQYVKFEGIKRNPPAGVISANVTFEGAPREIPKTEMALKPAHDNTNDLLLAPTKAENIDAAHKVEEHAAPTPEPHVENDQHAPEASHAAPQAAQGH